MSKILLEADFTADLRAIYSSARPADEQQSDGLENILVHNGLENQETIKKIIALGEPLKKAVQVLGENKDKNPILAFVTQSTIQNLILTGTLNADKFKAIYNAVAKKLVADSEFFKENSYNIIYCKALYEKTTKEIEKYLTLQSSTLKPTASSYDKVIQAKNRKKFLEATQGQVPDDVRNARLKSIEDIVKNSDDYSKTVHRNANELDNIVSKLETLASKFAAILALSTSTKSVKAKKALTDPKFDGLDQKQIANAFLALSNNNILPKGQLKEDDADMLVLKILATLESSGPAK